VEELVKTINEEQVADLSALYLMDGFCRKLLASPDQDWLGKSLIESYLSKSVVEAFREEVGRGLSRLLEGYEFSEELGELESTGRIYLWADSKGALRFLSLFLLRLLLRGEALSSNVTVLLPYGGKGKLEEEFTELAREVGIPVIPPSKVLTLPKGREAFLKQEEDLKRALSEAAALVALLLSDSYAQYAVPDLVEGMKVPTYLIFVSGASFVKRRKRYYA